MVTHLGRCIALLASIGCMGADPVVAPAPEMADRAAVYSAAIEYLFVSPTTRQVVVAPFTYPDELTVESLEENASRRSLLLDTATALSETWRDYVLHNAEPEEVPPLQLSTAVEFVAAPQFTPAKRSRDTVLVDFPRADGYVVLSGIGFDAARREAIVSVFQSCGPLCGSGGLLVFERDNDGRWVLRRQLTFMQA